MHYTPIHLLHNDLYLINAKTNESQIKSTSLSVALSFYRDSEALMSDNSVYSNKIFDIFDNLHMAFILMAFFNFTKSYLHSLFL